MALPRIVSLVSSATEILFGLGLGEQVVGISHECDWPDEVKLLPRLTRSRIASSAVSCDIDAQVRSLLTLGEALYELDIELLESLAPDLVITQAQCDVCAVRYQEVETAIRISAALAKTKIIALSPSSLDEVFDDIRTVGGAAGVDKRAAMYVDELKRRVDFVHRGIVDVPIERRPRVCVVEWFNPLMMAGNWVPGLIELAGGRCGLSSPGLHSPAVDWSALLEYNPEVMILAPCGFDVARAQTEFPHFAAGDGYSRMDAVRHDRVHLVDGNAYFNRPGPRLVDTLELLAALIHRDEFPLPPSAQCRSCGD
jgi:iron complex transport system substrate-binding protein